MTIYKHDPKATSYQPPVLSYFRRLNTDVCQLFVVCDYRTDIRTEFIQLTLV